MKQAQDFAAGSVVVGLAVLALKTAAWMLTGSAALFSDAAETVVNVAAAVIATFALRLAARPADANHPYGHDKAEFFAAVIEGSLIVVAAIMIIQHAWEVYRAPRPIEAPMIGLALNGASTVLNLAWGLHLRHVAWLDPALAAAPARYILYSGYDVVRDSVGGLMDAAPAATIVDRIRALVGENAAGAIEAHDLRMRHAGRMTFLEFHLVVPGSLTVADAHAICDRVEDALKAEMEGLVITIHVEPEGKAKHRGVIVL